jgi:hypothetical protein
MYNTIFDLDEVATALEDAGFTDITLARSEALDTPLEAPEQAHRVFFIARA